MMDDIEEVIINVKKTDKIYDEIKKLKSKISNLKKELKNQNDEKLQLLYGNYQIDKTPLKRTFNEILDEIASQNNISRGNLLIEFEEKTCGGYFFRTDESKRETIEKEIDKWGSFPLSFSIATNPDCLEKESIFKLYPITDEEKKKEKELERKRKLDPLYSKYRYNTRPFEVQNNGKKMIDLLHREEGISAEMFWFFSVDKYYGEMFYYIEPKYIDLDDNSPFSKAIKNLLTKEELEEYYEKKKNYEKYIDNKDELIKEKEEKIKQIEENIKQIKEEIYGKEKEIKKIKWPTIKIKIGDFIESIYRSDETRISPNNSEIEISGSMYEEDIDEFSEDSFMLRIKSKQNHGNFIEDFNWKMKYCEEMYDKKTLYSHFKQNRSFDRWSFKNKFKGLKKTKDFVMYFNPEDFFRDKTAYKSLKVLKEKTIIKIVIKCMLLEKIRNNEINQKQAYSLYEKYIDMLTNKNPKHLKETTETKEVTINKKSSKKEKQTIEEVLKIVRKNVYEFVNLNPEFQNNREIVLEAVSIDGMLLKYVSERLKGDKEIVITAIKSNPLALKYSANIYKNDENIVLYCVSKCGLSLKYASPTIKDNKEVVEAAIQNDEKSLRYASDRLKEDREIVYHAVSKNAKALQYANKKYLSDKNIVKLALIQEKSDFLLPFIDKKLYDDREIMMIIYYKNKALFDKYASPRLKDEISFELLSKLINQLETESIEKPKVKKRLK